MLANMNLFAEAEAAAANPDNTVFYCMVSKIWLANGENYEMREFDNPVIRWDASLFESESRDEIKCYTEFHEATSNDPMPTVKMLTWHICKDDETCDVKNTVFSYVV